MYWLHMPQIDRKDAFVVSGGSFLLGNVSTIIFFYRFSVDRPPSPPKEPTPTPPPPPPTPLPSFITQFKGTLWFENFFPDGNSDVSVEHIIYVENKLKLSWHAYH